MGKIDIFTIFRNLICMYIYPNIFDEELKKYIDYDALFEKFYIGVLNLIRNPLNLFKDDFDDW